MLDDMLGSMFSVGPGRTQGVRFALEEAGQLLRSARQRSIRFSTLSHSPARQGLERPKNQNSANSLGNRGTFTLAMGTAHLMRIHLRRRPAKALGPLTF
jgi:hypothetical protein